ncbi:MAG: hypothetical protein R6U65_07270 [Perlabentimonas sp.]
MSFYFNGSSPTDTDLEERTEIIESGKQEEEDWVRVQLYNWKSGIEELETRPNKYDLYKKWAYWQYI